MTFGIGDSVIIGAARRLSSSTRKIGGSTGLTRGSTTFSFVFKDLVINKVMLDYVTNSPIGDVGKYLKKRGRLMVALAKRQAGKETGALRNSITMTNYRTTYGQNMKIGSNLNYALAHHNGTRPHLIRPEKAEILRFTAGSRVVYSREVMHPGTKPNRFLSDQLWVMKI